jgi:surface protein
MEGMFFRASAFNHPVNSWDTSKTTTMTCMFFEASAFDQLVGSWDTSKVTDMENIFKGATSMTHFKPSILTSLMERMLTYIRK